MKAGKFLKKKTGRKEETIIPPKFLKELASKTFLAVGRVKTVPMFFAKAARGLPYAAASYSFFAFFSASSCFLASLRYLPLSGSFTRNMVARPRMAESPAIIPY